MMSVEPEPLIPLNDKTVFYTNSVTTKLKYCFLNAQNLPNEGVYFSQPCLHFQSLNNYLDLSFSPKWMTYEIRNEMIYIASKAFNNDNIAARCFDHYVRTSKNQSNIIEAYTAMIKNHGREITNKSQNNNIPLFLKNRIKNNL